MSRYHGAAAGQKKKSQNEIVKIVTVLQKAFCPSWNFYCGDDYANDDIFVLVNMKKDRKCGGEIFQAAVEKLHLQLHPEYWKLSSSSPSSSSSSWSWWWWWWWWQWMVMWRQDKSILLDARSQPPPSTHRVGIILSPISRPTATFLFFDAAENYVIGAQLLVAGSWNLLTLLALTGALIVGGGTIGTKTDFLKVFKWILLSFQYIRTGKNEFLNLVTVLTLHTDPQYLKNHYIRVKNQSCRRPMVWPIKTCARKALSQPKKNWLNRTYQLREKSKKLPENTIF